MTTQPEKAPRRAIGAMVARVLGDDAREIVPALADWVDRILHRQARTPVTDTGTLTRALAEHARFLAQSSVYAYCRARTGFMAPKLFSEAPFLESSEIAAREAHAACLADLTLLAEGALRGTLRLDARERARLFAAIYREALEGEGVPAHRTDWSDAIEDFERRLAFAVEAPPKSANDIAGHAGSVVFEYLPFHEDMLRFDEQMVLNSVRFRMVRTADDLFARFDRARLAENVAPPPEAPAAN